MKIYFYVFLVSFVFFFFLSRVNREPLVTPLGTFLVPGDVLHFWRLLLSPRGRRNWGEIGLQSFYVLPFIVTLSALGYSTYQLFTITVPLVESAAHGLSKSLICLVFLGYLATSLEEDRED